MSLKLAHLRQKIVPRVLERPRLLDVLDELVIAQAVHLPGHPLREEAGEGLEAFSCILSPQNTSTLAERGLQRDGFSRTQRLNVDEVHW